jgi:secondary thiamine-phosphate synthase enzyme
MKEITINTSRRNEFVVIDHQVQEVVAESGIKEGCVVLYCPHTTAALTVNENADPSVVHDILSTMEKQIPPNAGYTHMEGNSDAHIKSSLFGPSLTIPVTGGKICQGTWQGLFFCEFDGPRRRKLWIQVIGEK